MLLDRSHRHWMVGTLAVAVAAVAVYLWFFLRTPGGLYGGSTVGLWYGIIGSGLMVYAGLLSAQRKLERRPWWGLRKTWVKGHIWLGLLSVVFIACHARLRLGGAVTVALWVVLAAVILSGIFGLILQQFVPGWIARRFPAEVPYGQMPHVCRVLLTEADTLIDSVAPEGDDAPGYAADLRAFHDQHVRPFLKIDAPARALLRNTLQSEAFFATLRGRVKLGEGGSAEALEALDRLDDICKQRRRIAEQQRMYHWLHGWLMVHIPLSIALLVLGVAHALMTTVKY